MTAKTSECEKAAIHVMSFDSGGPYRYI
jgi:hypothetical protein